VIFAPVTALNLGASDLGRIVNGRDGDPDEKRPLSSPSEIRRYTQHATHESKTKYTLLYAKEHSAQPDMFWRTHYTKSDPISMRVMPLCLWGV
jgi:hypothetical protein